MADVIDFKLYGNDLQLVEIELDPGEVLRADTGSLVGFASTVDYDVQFLGGFRNALFGGEGLFLVRLAGPGTVLLQSLPLSRLAERLRSAMPVATTTNVDAGE